MAQTINQQSLSCGTRQNNVCRFAQITRRCCRAWISNNNQQIATLVDNMNGKLQQQQQHGQLTTIQWLQICCNTATITLKRDHKRAKSWTWLRPRPRPRPRPKPRAQANTNTKTKTKPKPMPKPKPNAWTRTYIKFDDEALPKSFHTL